MDIVEIYRSDDIIIYEIYYTFGKLDTLIIYQRKGSIVYKTKAEISYVKLHNKKRTDNEIKWFMDKKSLAHRREMEA